MPSMTSWKAAREIAVLLGCLMFVSLLSFPVRGGMACRRRYACRGPPPRPVHGAPSGVHDPVNQVLQPLLPPGNRQSVHVAIERFIGELFQRQPARKDFLPARAAPAGITLLQLALEPSIEDQ